MAYMALYRKWRPMTFDEVVEQEAVVTVLRNAVLTGRIAHAYLFCGTRGTGKTTMAKIFARAVNCLNPQNGSPCNECDVCKSILNQQILDVSEIDAASNNGVDNIRSIIEETAYASSVAKYKVFIIDEVHMLSPGAFNALLKTLEEPPEGVIFILATTEPNKLPVTILSRCQRYDFKRISQSGIIGRLEHICSEQGIQYEMPALAFLAQKSDGALRDAISLLDQTLASCGGQLTLRAARASTGSIDKEFVENFALNIINSNGAEILRQVSVLFSEGRDPSDFIAELMQIYRNTLVLLTVKNTDGILYETPESLKLLNEIASASGKEELSLMIRELSKLDNNLKWAVQRKILFEAGMLSLCDRKWDSSEASLSERIAALEKRLSDVAQKGVFVPSSASAASEPIISNAPIQKAPVKSEPNTNSAAESESVTVSVPEQTAPPGPRQTASSQPAASSARESDALDWKEFIMNISSKGQAALSSLIRINSEGVLDGKGNLILVFANPIVKDMIVKKDASDLLAESASAAYGTPLKILYATKKELPELLTQPVMPASGGGDLHTANAQDADNADIADTNANSAQTFENAVDILRKLSEQEGFPIENK